MPPGSRPVRSNAANFASKRALASAFVRPLASRMRRLPVAGSFPRSLRKRQTPFPSLNTLPDPGVLFLVAMVSPFR